MAYRELSRILGNYLIYFALILCFPLLIAIYYDYFSGLTFYPQSVNAFLLTILICFAFAIFFRILGKKSQGILYRRDSIFIVVLIWFISAMISALPFYFTKTLENPIDAYFEAMSGLTTTGATIITPKTYSEDGTETLRTITNIHLPDKSHAFYGTIKPIIASDGSQLTGLNAVARPILFWRSLLQWLGGMGIVVIFVTVLPALGVGGKFIYQMEVTGPVKETISPRIKETASLLWKLYLGLTFFELILLITTNSSISLYDAICIVFSNISTGGFSVNPDSIGHYANSATEWVVLAFMILGSINFALYFHIIRLKFYRIYSPEFFLFVSSLFIGSFLVSFFLAGNPLESFAPYKEAPSYLDTFRTGAFQAISAQTSTGFTTANYDLWPYSSQLFMLLLMFFGGMAGSTCGGIKTTRFYILYKIIIHKIRLILRPDTVTKLKVGKIEINHSIALTVMAFVSIAIFFTVLGIALYTIDGIDPETSLSLTTCMLNNIGISFRMAGPDGTFAFLSPFSKLISTFWMVLGRLEYLSLLLLFLPGFWKNK